MLENFPEDASTCSCYIRQPILSINPLTSQFPAALSESLERLEISFENAKDKDELRKKTAAWITPLVAVEGLDADIQTVLQFSLRKLET
jgi:U3 small nucleolar RNA-associated protein 6